jgi:hypothetical protein
MKLNISLPPSTRRPRLIAPAGMSAGCVIAIGLAVVLIAANICSPTRRSSNEAVHVVPISSTAPVQAISVHETSDITPGFGSSKWGTAPTTGMQLERKGKGLETYRRKSDCLQFGKATVCDIHYVFFRKRFFAVEFSNAPERAGAARLVLLPTLEALWGPATEVNGHMEWRSRQKRLGLTIATWQAMTHATGNRWEKVRVWSDRIERERLAAETASAPANTTHARRSRQKESTNSREPK